MQQQLDFQQHWYISRQPLSRHKAHNKPKQERKGQMIYLRNKLGEGFDVHSGGPLAGHMVGLLRAARLLYLHLHTTCHIHKRC